MHHIQFTSLSFFKYNENIGQKSNLHVNFAIIPFSFLPPIAVRVNLYITRKDCIYDVGQICRKKYDRDKVSNYLLFDLPKLF